MNEIPQVGEKMIIRRSGLGGYVRVAEVTKVCAKSFVCGNMRWSLEQHWRYMEGRSKWVQMLIQRATPERLQEIAKLERRRVVMDYCWREAPQQLIDAVYALFDPTPAPKETTA